MDDDVPGLPWFTQDLLALRGLCGEASLRELGRISRKFPQLYGQQFSSVPLLSVAVLSRLHNGQRRTSPGWLVVAAYVLANQHFGATKAGLLSYDPGPETLSEWRRWHSLADGPRPQEPPPYASLPLRKQRQVLHRDPSSGLLLPGPLPSGPALRIDPGDDQALVERLTHRYRSTPPQTSTDSPGSGGPQDAGSGPECVLAAPTAAAQTAQLRLDGRGQVQPWPGRSGRRLPTVDELLEEMAHEQHRAPSRQRTATGLPFYGGAEPPRDALVVIRPGLRPPDRDRCRQLLGAHGIALLQAAEYGDADAAARLGVLYCCVGFRSESDRWLSLAAGYGDIAAAALLAVRRGYRRTIAAEIAYELALPATARIVHRHGDGDDYSYAAEVYYRAAADCGHVDAAYRLAVLCQLRGNDMEAGYWASQAARDGHPLGRAKFEAIYHAMTAEGWLLGPLPHLPDALVGDRDV